MAQAVDAQAILLAATRSDWDRQFLQRPQIHQWVLGEIALAPFDPSKTTLLEYVKGRMALAEQLRNQMAAQQKQQQQQQQPVYQSQQPVKAQSPPRPAAVQPVAPAPQQVIEIADDDDAEGSSHASSSGPEDAMEFDLDDFVDTSAVGPNGLVASRTPSPLPQAQASASASQPPLAPTTPICPFTNGQYGLQPPFQATSQQQQPTALNPAALFLNSQQPQQYLQPHQLQQSQQYMYPGQVQASGSAISPAQLLNGQKRPRANVEVEVVIPARRDSPSYVASPAGDSVKRQKTALGQSISPPPQASTSAPTTAAQPAPSPTPARPAQTEADRVWDSIEKDINRLLKIANRAPNKSVRKLFDLMSAYVTEPENASARNIRDAKATDLKVPARGRKAILDTISAETNEDFDTVFVVDPRATVLVAAWVKDLARIARGKDKEPEDDELKAQSRLVMEVLKKLPITLEVLTSLTGVGRHVDKIALSKAFDEVTRDLAATLVEKWKRLIDKDKKQSAPAARKRSETPTLAPTVKVETDRKKRRLSPPPSLESQPVKPTTVKVESKSAAPSAGATTTAGATTKAAPGNVRPIPTAAAKSAALNGTKPLPATKPVAGGKPLPAFAKRKPAPAKAAPKPAAPAPAPAAAAFDPFATALSDMVRQKEESQGGMSLGAQLSMVNNAINSTSAGGISTGNTVPRAGKKQKKSVRWEAQENLEKVKYVEVLVYGDEFGNEIASSDYFNTTGEARIGEGDAEGVALAGLAEEMDWEEPQLVDVCLSADFLENHVPYPNPDLMGDRKSEFDIQTEREAGVLAVTYFDESEIPNCPTEPASVVNELPLPDDKITQMNLSWDMRKDDQVQMAIAAAQTRPFERANKWHTASAGPTDTAPSQSAYGQQAPQPQMGAGSLGGDNLSALLAKLSQGGLSIPNAQPPVQYHQRPYQNWQ